jgi:CheY-like chemotaxis protein
VEKRRLLWVDDEIELLRSQIKYLELHGYEVVGVTNGDDALEQIFERRFDVVLLDEQMMGLSGTQTLTELKRVRPELPVVMVTKNEEESLMDEAYGLAAEDFVIKPVRPTQLTSVLKRILDRHALETASFTQRYMAELRQLDMSRDEINSAEDWLERYVSLMKWDIAISDAGDPTLLDLHRQLIRDDNHLFSQYIIKHYPKWVQDPDNRPILSVDLLPKVVVPFLDTGHPVYLIVIDAMRYDAWLMFRRMLETDWLIDDFPYLSLVPTSTNYARNGIFSGLFPKELSEMCPESWRERSDESASLNRHEGIYLNDYLERAGIQPAHRPRYKKTRGSRSDIDLLELFRGWKNPTLYSLVINFLDILTHERSHFEPLSEISDNPQRFRSLAASWFAHSGLAKVLKELSRKDVTVIITSDHGSIQTERAVIAYCDKNTTKGLRLWFGPSLRHNGEGALLINHPNDWMLPAESIGKNYLIALEDYNFVFSHNQNEQRRFYAGAFQHGGISMQEMIIPCAIMHPK